MALRLTDHVNAEMKQLLLLADPSESAIDRYLENGQCFVFEQEGILHGIVVLLETRPKVVEIMNIAVRKEDQGLGLGKRIMSQVFAIAKRDGYGIIEVGTGNSSISQLVFYQKCGFRITGVDKDFFLKNYQEPIFENGIQCCDMIRLVKNL